LDPSSSFVRSFVDTGAAIAEAFGASFETATGAAAIYPAEPGVIPLRAETASFATLLVSTFFSFSYF